MRQKALLNFSLITFSVFLVSIKPLAQSRDASFSVDGSTIVYVSKVKGVNQIFTMDEHGNNKEKDKINAIILNLSRLKKSIIQPRYNPREKTTTASLEAIEVQIPKLGTDRSKSKSLKLKEEDEKHYKIFKKKSTMGNFCRFCYYGNSDERRCFYLFERRPT